MRCSALETKRLLLTALTRSGEEAHAQRIKPLGSAALKKVESTDLKKDWIELPIVLEPKFLVRSSLLLMGGI